MFRKLLEWLKSTFIVREMQVPALLAEPEKEIEASKNIDVSQSCEETSNVVVPSLATMLSEIDKTFMKLKTPPWSAFTTKETRSGLAKMGPMVIPSNVDWVESRKVHVDGNLPAIVFLATHDVDKYSNEDCTYPSFFYAVKHDRLPPECQHLKGIVYEVGFAYESLKRMRWVGMYATICPTSGKVSIAKTPLSNTCRIPLKRRRKGDQKEVVYNRKSWGMPEVVSIWAEDHKQEVEEYAEKLGEIFAAYINIWLQRHKHWRVSVKKENRRMTFLIKESDPKVFFKDRGVTVTTPTGQKKKIIHFVTEHTRVVNEKSIPVKEHIRGLRQFDWKGHSCSIVAPQFHKYDSDKFTASVKFEEDMEPGTKTISFSHGTQLLAELEDNQMPTYQFAT